MIYDFDGKTIKDIYWQYHLWINTLSWWQKFILPFTKAKKYNSGMEYFIINIYKPR